MSLSPIFVATHPRACSTAFERVMMTRTDILQCVHEPFGDAFYYGPERLSARYDGDEFEGKRVKSGFAGTTFGDVVERIEREGVEGKRVFIKDIIHYLLPPDPSKNPAQIAPSLRAGLNKKKGYGTSPGEKEQSSITNGTATNGHVTNGITTNGASAAATNGNSKTSISPSDIGNPTVIPLSILQKFHFTFLIRHPCRAIPSYYRCTIPPLSEMTGFDHFLPSEAGYRELRDFFDYVREKGLVGGESGVELCVLDADDLLDNPKKAVRAYCESVGIDYRDSMLEWGGDEGCGSFEKWKGFHEDAIKSSGLRARENKKKEKSGEEEMKEWMDKYGAEGAKVIKATVDENVEHYEYLKQFKMKF